MEHKLDPRIDTILKHFEQKRTKYVAFAVIISLLACLVFYFLVNRFNLIVISLVVAPIFIIAFLRLYPVISRENAYSLISSELGWELYNKDIQLKIKEGLLLNGKSPGKFRDIIIDYFSKKDFYINQFVILAKNLPIEFIYLSVNREHDKGSERRGIFFFPLRIQLPSQAEVIISNRPGKLALPYRYREYKRYKMESNDFNKRFTVAGSNHLLVYQVLHPSIIDSFINIDFYGLFVIKDKFLIIEIKDKPLISQFLTVVKKAYILIDDINDAFAKDLPEGNLIKRLNF